LTKIWVDVLTPKQALLFSTFISDVKHEYDCLVTTRKYDYTNEILKINNIKAVEIYKYGGGGKYEKLRASIERSIRLLKHIRVFMPDIALSFTSPDMARIAFGLGIPFILLTDSPHSVYVNKLTLPLANSVITPKCTAEGIKRFILKESRLYTFNGIFEVAWVARHTPNVKVIKKMGLEPYSYVVVRTEESKAAYYGWGSDESTTVVRPLIEALLDKLEVIVYTRYRDQSMYVKKIFGKHIKEGRLKLLKRPLDMLSLEHYAVLVITGGSSMAQESSLMGTPSITLFPKQLETFEYLRSKGFPIHFGLKIEDAVKLSLNIVSDPDNYRVKTKSMLNKMEDPIPLIKNVINELIWHHNKVGITWVM